MIDTRGGYEYRRKNSTREANEKAVKILNSTYAKSYLEKFFKNETKLNTEQHEK